jgi:hypothetical protein
MNDPSDWKCRQGRGECLDEPPEMPFAGFLGPLIDTASDVCGWAMVVILIGWIVSIVMRWPA